jgi:hypothetical protein
METTMRTLLLSVTMMLAACGGGGSDNAQTPAPPPPDTQQPPAATTPPPRTMGTARAMQTPAENLLFDPTFATLDNSLAFDLYGDGAHALVPATSPAGPASTVLVVDGSAAAAVGEYLMFGQGGSGPFDVKLFVATSKAQKDPVPVYFASMVDQNAVFQLDPVDGADQKHGSLTYRLYEAKVPGPIYGMVALAVDVSDATMTYTFAAPEVTSSAGLMTTMALSRPARRVALPAAARRELDAIASRPIVPGTSGETRRVTRKVPFSR